MPCRIFAAIALAVLTLPVAAQTAKEKPPAPVPVTVVGQSDPVTVTGMVQVAPEGATQKSALGWKQASIELPSAGAYNEFRFFSGPTPAGAALTGIVVTLSAGPSTEAGRYCSAVVLIAPTLGTVTAPIYRATVHAGQTTSSGFIPLPNLAIPTGEGLIAGVDSEAIPCVLTATAMLRVP